MTLLRHLNWKAEFLLCVLSVYIIIVIKIKLLIENMNFYIKSLIEEYYI